MFARPTDTTVFYPGSSKAYTSHVKYDDIFGRVIREYDALDLTLVDTNGVKLPSGVEILYNDYGYASATRDIGSGQLLHEIKQQNERGQVTEEYRGNGSTTLNTYNPLTGQLERQLANNALGFSVLQDEAYRWDKLGNLLYRHNKSANVGSTALKNKSESFCYDGLNRLVATLPGASLTPVCTGTLDLIYDGLGNIKNKKDVGAYAYASGSIAGPHAVTTAGSASYTYDNNGNQISGDGRIISYTSYDMAKLITKSGNSSQFDYGPDRARWQQKDTKAGVTTTTTYMGNVERIQVSNSAFVEWKRNVGGVIYTYKTNASNQIQAGGKDRAFVYLDHLGSVDLITDGVGKVINSLSFDPWGARRNGENWGALSASERVASLKINAGSVFAQPVTQRGFTGHEMVDDMGIIHMNGRIYDARLGRFLQADPNIDGAGDTQGYNRYSYVHNNPLNATDPSGFSAWTNFRDKIRPFVGVIIGVIVGIFCQVCGASIINAAITGAAIGAVSAAVNGGNILRGALTGFVSGAAFSAIGQGFANCASCQAVGDGAFGTGLTGTAFAEKVFAHAMAGGVMSVLQGGKFGSGFAAAGLTQAFSGAIDSIGGDSNGAAWADAGNRAARIVSAAIVGGTATVLSGGKFANGAITGAFSRAFNDEATHENAKKENTKVRNMIGVLKMEREWLKSLTPEDAEIYFKMGGLTGNTGEALSQLDYRIERQLLSLTTSGIKEVINDYPQDTSAGAFAELLKAAGGKTGLAGSAFSSALLVKDSNDMHKLLRLFGNNDVKYGVTYVCGSSCKLNINYVE